LLVVCNHTDGIVGWAIWICGTIFSIVFAVTLCSTLWRSDLFAVWIQNLSWIKVPIMSTALPLNGLKLIRCSSKVPCSVVLISVHLNAVGNCPVRHDTM
jgi:hypothetical protein